MACSIALDVFQLYTARSFSIAYELSFDGRGLTLASVLTSFIIEEIGQCFMLYGEHGPSRTEILYCSIARHVLLASAVRIRADNIHCRTRTI